MAVLPAHPRSIEAVGPPEPPRRKEIHSIDGVTGLYLTVTASGTKSWVVRYTSPHGGRRQMTLGQFPDVSLARAKELATARRVQAEEGVDPLGEREDPGEGTMGDLFGLYFTALERDVDAGRKSPRTLNERRRILAGAEFDRIRKMAPTAVTARDVARALDAFEERDALVAMNRAQLALSAVFSWAVTRHRYGLEANPVEGMERRHQESPRERVLDADEIRAMWEDLEEREDVRGAHPLTRAALRLILLTGQRPGEVRRMLWAHIDIDARTWTMPKGYRKRTKADRGRESASHTVHLSEPACRELERIKGYERGGYVFPAKSGRKPRSRQSLARPVARMCDRLDMPRWTPHDLRRTARTGLAELDVDAVVAEKIVGHALPPILRVYDVGDQMEARTEALDRWGREVLAIVRSATT